MRTVFLLALLTSGCVTEMAGEAEEAEETEGDDEIGTSSRVALNGLTARSTMNLTTDPMLLPLLAQGSLASAGSRVPALFTTEHGRRQFSYIYSCAERGKTISISSGGVSYSFTGTMGLATEWTSSALPTTKYAIVTACMLARTNYTGAQVSISMRNSRIATTSTELAAYTVVEGAFWGDVFSSTPTMRACPSAMKLSGAAISTLPDRECTVSLDGLKTMCGFGYAGECSKVCVTDLTKAIGYSNCERNADTIVVYVAKP
jgi:hypothetical protein